MAQTICILGGGAAGLTAAIAAAEAAPAGTRVVLVERSPRVGKKLLATGNGRCNLTNVFQGADRYFTSDPAALAACLAQVQKASPQTWLEAHGLWCRRPDEAGRVYPYSNQASDLLNLLLGWLDRTGVEVRTGCAAASLRQSRGGWAVQLEDGQTLHAQKVICALGGSAGPQFGTDGFGPELARLCGLRMEPLYPCLVPLACSKTQVQGLAGIRVRANVTLTDGGRPLAAEEGEVQFTEYGLSGIAVMQMSGRLRPRKGPKDPAIRLDLFPHVEEADLAAAFAARANALPGASLAEFMTGLVNHRVGLAVAKAAGLDLNARPDRWQTLAHAFKNWTFTGLAPLDWKAAQTTGGGIALGEVEPHSFMLKGCPGLYFVGETLDCAGACGGYNLHWAFGTGITAGAHAGRRC